MDNKKQTSIKFKILGPIVLIILIGNIISFAVIASNLTKNSINQVNMDLTHVLNGVSEAITSANDREQSIIETLANVPQIKDENISLYEKSQLIFDFFKVSHGKYIDMCILDTKGDAYINGSERIVNFSERSYYKEALKGNFYIEKPFINKVTNAMAVFYSIPVYDKDNEINNVIFSVIDGYKYCELMAGYTVGKNSNPLIFDRLTGALVGCGDTELFATLPNIADMDGFSTVKKEILSGNEGMINFKSQKTGAEYVAAYSPVKGTTWTVIAPVPITDFMEEFTGLQRLVICIYIMNILVTIFFTWVILTQILAPLKSVKNSIRNIAIGDADLTQRIKDSKHHDEVSNVVKGFNDFVSMLHRIVSEIKKTKLELSQNGVGLESITYETSSSINEITTQLELVENQLKTQIDSVNNTISKVSDVSEDINSLNALMEQQVSGVTEASSSVKEMIANIANVGSNIESMSSNFNGLLKETKNGCKMQEDVNQLIKGIEEQSETLGAANQIIADIAEQTNLLAMNAAIEAAHAGDAGKGFSVVADEIRKLSETSTIQSQTIGEQLSTIQGLIENVVEVSEKTLQVFNSVIDSIENTDTSVREIKKSIENQEENSNSIVKSLEILDATTKDVYQASEQMQNENNSIQKDITHLDSATDSMKTGFSTMEDKISGVKKNSDLLVNISIDIKRCIIKIGRQIDQFKV